MRQNKKYGCVSSVRHRKKKKYFIVFLTAFVIMTSITILAMSLSPEPLEKGEAIRNTASEAQTEQLPPLVEETEKNDTITEHAITEHVKSTESDNDHEETAIAAGYNYTKPVPESDMVENSYFDDAVFIGDSRTEGLILYTGLSNAISYTNKGLMVDTVFTQPVINKNGEKMSVMNALQQTDFNKVYIMLGINETGWPYDNIFIEKYGKIIDEIQSINPQAVIYVQEILPVTNSISQSHSYVKNEKINEFNALIRKMAEEKQIYYIDAGKAVSDENGCLPEDAAIDGIHLKKPYCEKWLDYLKTHTVADIEVK